MELLRWFYTGWDRPDTETDGQQPAEANNETAYTTGTCSDGEQLPIYWKILLWIYDAVSQVFSDDVYYNVQTPMTSSPRSPPNYERAFSTDSSRYIQLGRPMTSTPTEANPLQCSPDGPPDSQVDMSKGSRPPSIVQKYYSVSATRRHEEDELGNMGPRPFPQSSHGSEHAELDDYQSSTEDLSPEEYDRKKVELVLRIQHLRQEEARLKRICEEDNHTLESDSENGELDGAYRQMLDMMETGPSRIDALLAQRASTRPDGTTAPLELEAVQGKKTDQIADWLSDVDGSGPPQLSHPP